MGNCCTKRSPLGSTMRYRIGREGEAWNADERKAWLKEAHKDEPPRSYRNEVRAKLEKLSEKKGFKVFQYGSLDYIDGVEKDRYPLFAVKVTATSDAKKPRALVTGGVHGYEKSGVQGALQFLEEKAQGYADRFDLLVCPCISPWGYEMIQRWNANADDPNRGFFWDAAVRAKGGSSADPMGVAGTKPDTNLRPECEALKKLVKEEKEKFGEFDMHIDLHETTDTDESEFRPAKCARDGLPFKEGHIPDGFYLVGDSKHLKKDEPDNANAQWHQAIIEAVDRVTHIAPPERDGTILGVPEVQRGCIALDVPSLALCASVTGAAFATTTEVYPDSEKCKGEGECNLAQVVAVTAALDGFLKFAKK